MRTVHCLMAPGCPAGALRKISKPRMQGFPNPHIILLKSCQVALQTKVAITDFQHSKINRSMGFVAQGTAFPHGLVLEYEGPALGCVAFITGLTFRG